MADESVVERDRALAIMLAYVDRAYAHRPRRREINASYQVLRAVSIHPLLDLECGRLLVMSGTRVYKHLHPPTHVSHLQTDRGRHIDPLGLARGP